MNGIKATLLGQSSKILIQFFGLIILSRLIEPRFFGFVALQVTILSFLELIREWGNSTISLQSKKKSEAINMQDRKTWFWISLFSGVGLSLVYVLCLLLILPRTTENILVAGILGSTLVASGLGAQHNVHLVLKKKFNLIYTIEVAAQAIALMVALYLISISYPLMALTVQYATMIWVTSITKALVSKFRPAKPTLVAIKTYYKRGKSLAGMSAASYWNYNLDNIFISQRFGESALGVYNRAFQLYMVPVAQFIWPLEKVVLVHSESKIEQVGSGSFLLKMQNQLHLLSGFAFSVLGSIGYLLVPMLLGQNWSETSQVLSTLCLAGLIQVPMLVSHWGFLTSGKNSGLFSIGLIRLVSFALALSLLGTKLEYVAYAVIIANLVSWTSSLFWLNRSHPSAEVRNLFNNACRIILSGGLTIVLIPLSVALVRPDSQIVELVIAICFSIISFLSLLLLFGTGAQRSVFKLFLNKVTQKIFLGRHAAK